MTPYSCTGWSYIFEKTDTCEPTGVFVDGDHAVDVSNHIVTVRGEDATNKFSTTSGILVNVFKTDGTFVGTLAASASSVSTAPTPTGSSSMAT